MIHASMRPSLAGTWAFLAGVTAATLLTAPAAAQMPPNSVARPVDPDESASSRVVVAVQPIGRVRYDGVTLPVTSPDGRFIVSQHGRTPSWETLLADRGQSIPVGLKLSVYRIDLPEPAPPDKPARSDKPEAPPRPASLTPVEQAEPLPPGLLLGRAADDTAFLVESPQPDGSRWIGRVRWLSGRIEWLASDQRVNAHATVAPHTADQPGPSRLAFVRRDLDERAFSLVLRSTDASGAETQSVYSAPDRSQSFLFPFFSPDGRTLAAFAIAADDPVSGPLQLVAFDLTRPSGELRPSGRIDLGRAAAGLHSAYQCVAAMQAPMTIPAAPAQNASPSSRQLFATGLLFFSPRDSAMAWWHPGSQDFLLLAAGSFAAVPFQHADFGFLLASPGEMQPSRPGSGKQSGGFTDALTYQPLRAKSDAGLSEPSIGREVAVLSSRAIPRATSHFGGIAILLAAPRSGEADSFDVLLLAPAVAP